MDLRTHLADVAPDAPEAKTCRLLAALLAATGGDRAAAAPLLESIWRDRTFPDYMAQAAGFFLRRHEGYVGAPILVDHEALDDLVCATVDRYAPQEIGGGLAELLARRFRAAPADPLSPFLALLALSYYAAADELLLVEELSAEILRVYPGSKYEARARLARVRAMRQAIQADANRIKALADLPVAERVVLPAHREALRSRATLLLEAVDETLRRFSHLAFVRKELPDVADALERLDTPELYLRFLARNAERLAGHPEAAELHLRLVMHHARHAPASETVARAREHLERFPESRHRPWMNFLRGQYLLERDDPAAFAVLASVVESGHPTWSDNAAEEALRWVRARREERPAAWLLVRLAPLEAFPFDGGRMAEFLYYRMELLKEAAIRLPAAERSAAFDRVLLLAGEIRERYPDSRFAGLAGVTAEEIRRGDIERAISVNRLTNLLIASLGLGYLAFFIYTATIYPLWGNWLFWVQVITLSLIASLFVVLKYVLGMF